MTNYTLWPDHVHLNLQKGESVPTLTHFPVDTQTRGAVIICPGGGYRIKTEHEGEPIARAVNQAGVHAFVLDYRVAPHRHPEPLLDAQRAIRTVRARAQEWHVNPDRIAILGFSAGGHLCCMAATHYDMGDPDAADPIDRASSRPDAFLPCYAVVSCAAFAHQASFYNLTGEHSLPAYHARALSAEYNLHPDTPPAFIWHTAPDAAVSVEHSIRLAQGLISHGVPCELHIFPYGKHGLGLAQDTPLAKQWPTLMGAWLSEMGFTGAP